jgi:hypothetical protein
MADDQDGQEPVRGPAVGQGGRLRRAVLWRRSAFALCLVLLLISAKPLVSRLEAREYASGQPVHAMAPGLIVGQPPTDYDLQTLAATHRVDGVISLGTPSVAEQVTADSLHLAYRYLAMAPRDSPTGDQVRALAGFMRKYATGSNAVYINDDVGGGPAMVTAAMLLMARGQSWPSVLAQMTHAEVQSMCECQLRAIARFGSALDHPGRGQAHDRAVVLQDSW